MMVKYNRNFFCHHSVFNTEGFSSFVTGKLTLKNKCEKIKLISYRLFFSILVFIIFSLISTPSFAIDSDLSGSDYSGSNLPGSNLNHSISPNPPDFNATTHGSVWILPGDGVYIEALQLQTHFNVDISGMITRTRVKQQFENDSSLWAEGMYLFPLPDKAAVDHFRLLIDGRVIEGQIEKKETARKTYEKAKSNGQRSALLEQKRANLFTTKLSNISPGAKITIEIEYQQTLDYNDGFYSLRLPMVIGERYLASSGATDNPMQEFGGYKKSTDNAVINPATISINMDTGMSVTNINSPTHKVLIRPQGENRYEISLVEENVPADRDFILSWQPALTDLPKAIVFGQHHKGYDYKLISVFPPKKMFDSRHEIARDIIFILDVSGSMAGTSIEQAKAALIMALQRLNTSDRFNIIWFNDKSHKMFDQSHYAYADNVRYAQQFVSHLEADGGTEMMTALNLAFAEKSDLNVLRQMVFLTDGNVSNESELFFMIKKQLKSSRLFTVGIGSAPNGFFMKRAAKAGRGSYTFISDSRFVKQKVDTLLRKLESPALTNIQLQVKGDEIEIFQNPVPDLYVGEPVNILLRAKNLIDDLLITGNIGGINWQHSIDLKQKNNNTGIKTAWAREKISTLVDSFHESDNKGVKQLFKQKIIEVSKSHHLVSPFTSLVAVDVTPVNQGGVLYQEKIKSHLPHGWSGAAKHRQPKMLAQIHLPQTATNLNLNFILGIFFISICFLVMMFRKYNDYR